MLASWLFKIIRDDERDRNPDLDRLESNLMTAKTFRLRKDSHEMYKVGLQMKYTF